MNGSKVGSSRKMWWALGIIPIIIMFVGWLCLLSAWEGLQYYEITLTNPPFSNLFFEHPIPAMHDAGIFISTIGVALVFLALIAYLPNIIKPFMGRWKRFRSSDRYYMVWFILLMLMWFGVWVIMHQAYVLKTEQILGHVTDPVELWIFPVDPPTLHLFGTVWVFGFCLLFLAVTLYFLQRMDTKHGPVADVVPLRSKIWQVLKEQWVKIAKNKREVVTSLVLVILTIIALWFIFIDWMFFPPYILLIFCIIAMLYNALKYDQTLIRKDWIFFGITFIPYFLAAFAVWIFMYEGFFARLYTGVVIEWAWLPLLEWTPKRYFTVGIVLLIIAVVSLYWMIVFVSSADPQEHFVGAIPKMKLLGYYFLVILSFFVLIIGMWIMIWAYISIPGLYSSYALFYHFVGMFYVLVSLSTVFFLVVFERKREIGLMRKAFAKKLDDTLRRKQP